jgi:hypothetical protein
VWRWRRVTSGFSAADVWGMPWLIPLVIAFGHAQMLALLGDLVKVLVVWD